MDYYYWSTVKPIPPETSFPFTEATPEQLQWLYDNADTFNKYPLDFILRWASGENIWTVESAERFMRSA